MDSSMKRSTRSTQEFSQTQGEGYSGELQAVTRLPMDSSMKRSTRSTQEFSQTQGEGYSADTQAVSEGLAQNLSDLTLNPSTASPSLPPEHSSQQQDTGNNSKASGLGLNPRMLYTRRRGARTVASVQEEVKKMRERLRLRMIRRLDAIKYRTLYLNKPGFKCGCSHCLLHPGPLDCIIDNYGMEPF